LPSAIVQMLADLAILGTGVRVIFGAVQRGRERRSQMGDDAAAQGARSTPR
jgi:hypothetical protein